MSPQSREDKERKVERFASDVQELADVYRLMAADIEKVPDRILDQLVTVAMRIDELSFELQQAFQDDNEKYEH